MEKGIFKTVIAMLATFLTWLFGAWDTALCVLISFMALDYCTGLIKGCVFKKLSSDIGLKGLARKAVIFVVLIVAVLLDRLSGNGQWIFRTLVCYFYIANEGISILENCAQLGLPVPVKIKDALVQLKDGGKKNV
ncbi:Cph1 family holin [Ruminiclostridium sufflavum DSM 19573]|uniref:Cph1 family holin n=1 Tax=Ruminiclostridium sufflavum DSM 19573 TaxID=1121337 RepID=A0A318XRC7_9FIRM|nr:phage holin family protein [Ruminiclostridium sufflavum]PYG90127.1 Cph1 family holin [Ruminiclostridium sufflavum DSM 19573]